MKERQKQPAIRGSSDLPTNAHSALLSTHRKRVGQHIKLMALANWFKLPNLSFSCR